MNAIVLVSGGLDSVTLAYKLRDWDLHLLSFDYGQKHERELAFAIECARELGVRHSVLDLTSVGSLLKGSALTDLSVNVPSGRYAPGNMEQTVVPNRNVIMLSVAFAIAASEGKANVAYAAHSGDHFIYADCRPSFTRAFQVMENVVLDRRVWLHTPFLALKKSDIVELGQKWGVPYDRTWSCYEGGEIHCGLCGTCYERREAFALAGVADPTRYANV